MTIAFFLKNKVPQKKKKKKKKKKLMKSVCLHRPLQFIDPRSFVIGKTELFVAAFNQIYKPEVP